MWCEGSAARAGAVARGEEEGSEMVRGTSAACVQRTASMGRLAAEVGDGGWRRLRRCGLERRGTLSDAETCAWVLKTGHTRQVIYLNSK